LLLDDAPFFDPLDLLFEALFFAMVCSLFEWVWAIEYWTTLMDGRFLMSLELFCML
jgi:hypothetical protein